METSQFLAAFLPALEHTFGSRVWFCGLQGSRTREEHRADSDFDMVVVLDTLAVEDVAAYRQMVRGLPGAELACGFLSGLADLLAWDPADLFHLCMDTRALLGTLETVWQRVSREAVERAVWRGACDIFHGCVHNMLYDDSDHVLRALLKSAAFVIQQIVYLRDGAAVLRMDELIQRATPEEGLVLSFAVQARTGQLLDLAAASQALFGWAQQTVRASADRARP